MAGTELTVSLEGLKQVGDPGPILEEMTKSIRATVEKIRNMPANTEADAKAITVEAAVCRAARVSLEKQRKILVEPFKEHTKRLDKAFAIPRDEAIEGEKLGGAKVSAVSDRIRADAEKAAQIEAKKQEKNYAARVDRAKDSGRALPPPPAIPEAHVSNAIGGAKQRTDWDFDVTDINAIPARFLEVKRGAILAALRAGDTLIPGIKAREITKTSFG